MNSDELATLYNLRIIEMILNDIYDRSDIISDLVVHAEIEKIYKSIHFLNDLYRNDVGRRIKQIRKNKGLNQTDFAKRIGATLPAVSNWETGKNLPNNERLKAIADIGNLTVDELLRGEAE